MKEPAMSSLLLSARSPPMSSDEAAEDPGHAGFIRMRAEDTLTARTG
jgi:hypothetical protein